MYYTTERGMLNYTSPKLDRHSSSNNECVNTASGLTVDVIQNEVSKDLTY